MSTDHAYTSTACQHELHTRCRDVCKFCDARCACSCHPWFSERDVALGLLRELCELEDRFGDGLFGELATRARKLLEG